MGVKVSRNGDLLNPSNNETVEAAIMSRALYRGLEAQGVNFSENYSKWSKDMMISKIASVMGIESCIDPDKSYVLTIDNVIKILAIQMRFRLIIIINNYYHNYVLLSFKNYFSKTNNYSQEPSMSSCIQNV